MECGGKRSATPPFPVGRNEGWPFDIQSQGGVALRLPPHSIACKGEALTLT